MRYLYYVFFVLVLTQVAHAGSLFVVSATGEPANLDMILCLNGKGKISCEYHTADALNVSIRTNILNQSYPIIGIKINTADYVPTQCSTYSNGYCLFSIPANGATLIPARGIIPM